MYPDFDYFVRNYYHQDWMLDSPSSLQVVEAFINRESPTSIQGLRRDIGEILALDCLSNDLVYDHGGNYNPNLDGLSTRSWLESVHARLVLAESCK